MGLTSLSPNALLHIICPKISTLEYHESNMDSSDFFHSIMTKNSRLIVYVVLWMLLASSSRKVVQEGVGRQK